MPAGSTDYRRQAISGFLRTRRAEIEPDPSWPIVEPGGSRRVPGLRREEVAWKAGVSVDYYVKVEQAKVRPSEPIITAIADALELTGTDTAYLRMLFDPNPPAAVQIPDVVDVDTARYSLEYVGTHLDDVLMTHLLDDELNITTLDDRTRAILFPGHDDRPERFSLLEYIFDDPVSRRVYVDWTEKAREVVGLAHMRLAQGGVSPQLESLIAHLMSRSSAFAHIFKQYRPYTNTVGSWRIRLPDNTTHTSRYVTVSSPTHPALSLVIYRSDAETERSDSAR